MAKTKSVLLNEDTHRQVKALAFQERSTVQTVVDRAVKLYANTNLFEPIKKKLEEERQLTPA